MYFKVGEGRAAEAVRRWFRRRMRKGGWMGGRGQLVLEQYAGLLLASKEALLLTAHAAAK